MTSENSPAVYHRAENLIRSEGMIQTWTFNQLAKLRYYRPDIVDQAVAEILACQSELRWLVVTGA